MLSVLLLAVSAGVTLAFSLSEPPAWAVPGERHYVEGEFALVREEPHGAAAVVARIPEGQEVIEIARQQNWLEVGVVRQGITGWVHRSFLAVARAARPRSKLLIPPMQSFRAAFDTFNTMKGAGVGKPFTSVTDRGDGVLLVSATLAWWSNSTARKQNDLASIYQMWKIANERLPVSVLITDPGGRRQLRRMDRGAPSVHP